MADYELDEIRRIRCEISARFNHDARRLGEYYQTLDEEYRKAGYKFAAPPPENPAPAESPDMEVAD